MIEQRRENLSEERYDLFSALLRANEFSTKDEGKLSESELLGNIFIFLLAGHEVCIPVFLSFSVPTNS